MVAAVGDVDLVRRGIDSDGRRPIQRRLAVGPFHLARLANLKKELSGARELQHVRIGGTRPDRRAAPPPARGRGRRPPAPPPPPRQAPGPARPPRARAPPPA